MVGIWRAQAEDVVEPIAIVAVMRELNNMVEKHYKAA